jgi:hypothetical protein
MNFLERINFWHYYVNFQIGIITIFNIIIFLIVLDEVEINTFIMYISSLKVYSFILLLFISMFLGELIDHISNTIYKLKFIKHYYKPKTKNKYFNLCRKNIPKEIEDSEIYSYCKDYLIQKNINSNFSDFLGKYGFLRGISFIMFINSIMFIGFTIYLKNFKLILFSIIFGIIGFIILSRCKDFYIYQSSTVFRNFVIDKENKDG